MNIFNSEIIAIQYSKTNAHQSDVFPWGIENIPKKGPILDIGCGMGNTLFYLSHYICDDHLYGIDSSHTMINLCNNRFKVSVSTADCLPFSNNQFNYVMSRYSFKWIDSKEQALKEIMRVLKPDGILLLWDSGKNEMRELLEATYKELQSQYCNDTVAMLSDVYEKIRKTPNDIEKILIKTGFCINSRFEKIETEKFSDTFDFEENWLKPFGFFEHLYKCLGHPNHDISARILERLTNNLTFTHDNFGFLCTPKIKGSSKELYVYERQSYTSNPDIM